MVLSFWAVQRSAHCNSQLCRLKRLKAVEKFAKYYTTAVLIVCGLLMTIPWILVPEVRVNPCVRVRKKWAGLPTDVYTSVPNFRERKTHKHKHISGTVLGLGGWQKFVYVFFAGHSL